MSTPAKYTATFSPEAWIDNRAVPIDPEGPTTWDCSAFVAANRAYFDRLEKDIDHTLDADDMLMGDPDAPQWVREWSGPFTIRVSGE